MSRTTETAAPATRDTREFAQQRAKETHAALLAAALEVFADKGFDDAQTPDIARAAGVSVGTFYRYFADKHQAFIEAITAHLERVHERVMSNLTVEVFRATLTAEERRAAIDHVIEILFQIVAEQPQLQRVFIGMSLRDPAVMRIRSEFAVASVRRRRGGDGSGGPAWPHPGSGSGSTGDSDRRRRGCDRHDGRQGSATVTRNAWSHCARHSRRCFCATCSAEPS